MLSSSQLQQVVLNLKKSGLKYEEVFEELIDHYAAAIEEKMQHGICFEVALQQVQQGFGGTKGIQRIQKRYLMQMGKRYRKLQWQNFRQQFKWPLIIATLIMAGLLYWLVFSLQGSDFILYLFGLIACLPVVIAGIILLKTRKRTSYSKETVRVQMLMRESFTGLIFLNLQHVLKILLGDYYWEKLLANMGTFYPAILSITVTLYLLYLLSFIRTIQITKTKLA